MADVEALLSKARRIGEILNDLSNKKRNVMIVSHLDADGIVSGSIIAKAMLRKKGRFTFRAQNNLRLQNLEELNKEDYDFYIFCELGGGMAKQITQLLDDKWLSFDHHQISEEEKNLDNVINSWQFGIDGTREISAGGMSYLIAYQMNECNKDLAWLAVVGALADRQDQGDDRSFLGLNEKIAKDAIDSQQLKVTKDLMFYGRETKPIHQALASTTTPFVPGLSGNADTCLATLSSIGISLKEADRWRTITDLSEGEKKKIVEAIIPYFAPAPNATDKLKELIGYVYTLVNEDEYTPLRDAREFSTLLNACGRLRRAGIGFSICLGDRDLALQEGEKSLADYKQTLNRYIQTISNDSNRTLQGKWSYIIIGDGLVDEDMLGSLSSIVSSIPRFDGKVILLRTRTRDGEITFSARRTPSCSPHINLGAILGKASKLCNGVGGGHDVAAGARIPPDKLDDFLKMVDKDLGEIEDKG